MKGFELPTNVLVIVILVVLVLSAVGVLFLTQTGSQQSIASSNEIFSVNCQNYKDAGCAWSVTHSANFPRFVSACQTLFGRENREYSCLYNYCCEQSRDKCDGLCALCKGNDYAAIGASSVESCLANYRDQCSGSCI